MRKKETVNTTHTQKSHNKKKFESEHFLLNRESSSFIITPFRYFCIFFYKRKLLSITFFRYGFLLFGSGGSNCDNSNESYWAILSSVWRRMNVRYFAIKYSVLLIKFRKKNCFDSRLKESRPPLSDFKAKVSSSSHCLLDRILCFFVCLSVSIRYELLSALLSVARNHLSIDRAIFVWPWWFR